MIWWVETDDTGVIIRWTSTPVEGWQAVEAEVTPTDTYLHNGRLLPLPPRPGAWALFDAQAGEWVDPRSYEERSAAHAAELAAARAEAQGQALAIVARLRAGFLTALPGQDMIYLRKEAEARAYVAAGAPSDLDAFPFLAAEIGITGRDAREVAQVILNLSAIWTEAGAALEALRLRAAADLSAAKSALEAAARVAQLAEEARGLARKWGME